MAKVTCIICTREYNKADKQLFTPLKHFNEYVICKECLRLDMEKHTPVSRDELVKKLGARIPSKE